MQIIEKLSNLQFELLKIYSSDVPEEDIISIKNLLATYFLEKAQKEIKLYCLENQITSQTLNNWSSEHNRI
jgi:hypothetical protein